MSASLWEMAIKMSVGKLDVPGNFFRLIYESGYLKLSIEIEHPSSSTMTTCRCFPA